MWGTWLPTNLSHWQTTSFMAVGAMAEAEAVLWPARDIEIDACRKVCHHSSGA
jgi:hypothetical protein